LERVNVEGTLLVLAEAARHFAHQACGGDIVLVPFPYLSPVMCAA
jgi:hypothetical protein